MHRVLLQFVSVPPGLFRLGWGGGQSGSKARMANEGDGGASSNRATWDRWQSMVQMNGLGANRDSSPKGSIGANRKINQKCRNKSADGESR